MDLTRTILLTLPLAYVAVHWAASRRDAKKMRQAAETSGALFLRLTWNGLPGGASFNRALFVLSVLPLLVCLAFGLSIFVTEPTHESFAPLPMLVLLGYVLEVNTYGPQRFLIGRGTFLRAGSRVPQEVLDSVERPDRGLLLKVRTSKHTKRGPVQQVTLDNLSLNQLREIQRQLTTACEDVSEKITGDH